MLQALVHSASPGRGGTFEMRNMQKSKKKETPEAAPLCLIQNAQVLGVNL